MHSVSLSTRRVTPIWGMVSWDGKPGHPGGDTAMCLHSDEAWISTANRSHCLNPFFLPCVSKHGKAAQRSSCSINQGPFRLQRMERCLYLGLGFPEYRTSEMAESTAGCFNNN